MSDVHAARLAAYLARLRDRGIRIELTAAGQPRFTGPLGALNPADKAYLRDNRSTIARQLRGTASDLGRGLSQVDGDARGEEWAPGPVESTAGPRRCELCPRVPPVVAVRAIPARNFPDRYAVCERHAPTLPRDWTALVAHAAEGER